MLPRKGKYVRCCVCWVWTMQDSSGHDSREHYPPIDHSGPSLAFPPNWLGQKEQRAEMEIYVANNQEDSCPEQELCGWFPQIQSPHPVEETCVKLSPSTQSGTPNLRDLSRRRGRKGREDLELNQKALAFNRSRLKGKVQFAQTSGCSEVHSFGMIVQKTCQIFVFLKWKHQETFLFEMWLAKPKIISRDLPIRHGTEQLGNQHPVKTNIVLTQRQNRMFRQEIPFYHWLQQARNF